MRLSYSKMASMFKNFIPSFDRILVQRTIAETKTKSGVLIPERAQEKTHTGVVQAVGQGTKTPEGNPIACEAKVGEKVLLPEYGGTKVIIENEEYFLFRDSDVLGRFSDK